MHRPIGVTERPCLSRRLWICCVAAVLAASADARAGLTLTSSNGTVTYALDYASASGISTNPIFNSAGQLTTPGGGFPILLGATEGNPTQIGGGPLSPPLLVQSVTGGSGNAVPPPFGTATTAIFAQGAGQQGALTNQGGIFWDTRTSLADGLRPTDSGLASVSYSTATSTFRNDTGAALLINPGALVSVRGTVGGSGGSFVAAGLASSYLLSGTSSLVNNAGIVLAANALGQTVNQTGNLPINATSLSYFNNQLFATASSFFGTQPISIAAGQSITIQATLTLISDPMSRISIVSDLAPGFPPQAPLPDFGAFAGGTDFNAVPEPSAIAMVGIGLATVGAWRARSRGRRPARA